MGTQIQTQSLRERIADAIAHKVTEQDAAAERAFASGREQLITQLRKRLGVEGEFDFTHNGHGRVEMVIEGLRFTARYDDYDLQLYVVLECEHCHKTEDRYASSIDSLASSLEHGLGWPHKDGQCLKQQEREQTKRQPVEERLLEALRDYIAEHSFQG